jgi:hypothetical protein
LNDDLNNKLWSEVFIFNNRAIIKRLKKISVSYVPQKYDVNVRVDPSGHYMGPFDEPWQCGPPEPDHEDEPTTAREVVFNDPPF